MYVCVCNGITDRDIRRAVDDGCRSLSELTMHTGCAGSCGSCAEFAAQILRDAQDESNVPFPLPVLSIAA